MHTGWSSTCCRSCGDGIDRWKPSVLACATDYPHRCTQKRKCVSPVTGTVSQATKTNGINRLPCGYLCCSRHWIGKSTSNLCPCCCHWGGRLIMVDCSTWALFESTHDTKHTKEVTYGKWSVQANIHMYRSNEVMLVWGSLRLAPIMKDAWPSH